MKIEFPSIGGLHHVRATLDRYDFAYVGIPVSYRAKIKLHGENKAIVVTSDGSVYARSRFSPVDRNDTSGFGAWAEANGPSFAPLARDIPLAVFGEWCGEGIARKAAICRIPGRIFAVFAVQVGVASEEDVGRSATFVVEPSEIAEMLAPLELPPEVRVLPWADVFEPTLDYHDKAMLCESAEAMNRDVQAVSNEDPWVKTEFGISGVGEGLVYYPISETPYPGSVWALATFAFKGKGIAHAAKAAREPIEIDPEKLADAATYAATFVTLARLEQGFRESVDDLAELRSTGAFIAWMLADVRKEGAEELAASNLEWTDVVKPVTSISRAWFLERVSERLESINAMRP